MDDYLGRAPSSGPHPVADSCPADFREGLTDALSGGPYKWDLMPEAVDALYTAFRDTPKASIAKELIMGIPEPQRAEDTIRVDVEYVKRILPEQGKPNPGHQC